MSTSEALSAPRQQPAVETQFARNWRLAALDLTRAVKGWHIWVRLAMSDIRLRYKRSRFGQFWITLSMAIFVTGIGVVYGGLFHMSMWDYLPYLAVNMTIWTLIQTSIGESCNAFIEAAPYLRQEALPRLTFILRVITRNLIALAHNIVIIPLVFLAFLYRPHFVVGLLAIPGMVLLLLAVFLTSLILSVLCTRFRDMPQVVGNMLQLAFFITPVMWHVDQLGENRVYIETLNPFTSLLRIVSEPILGRIPDGQTYLIVLINLAVLAVVAGPLFARFRARIVYWL